MSYFFIHFSVDGCLGHLHDLATVHSSTINSNMQIFVCSEINLLHINHQELYNWDTCYIYFRLFQEPKY